MSKSTPSTSTTQNINPIAEAQTPFLTNMWGQAATLGGWNFDTNSLSNPPVGGQYLDQLRNYAQNQANATQGPASNLVPSGMNYINAALQGQGGGYLPGASQIGALSNYAPGAVDTSNYFANLMGGAAASAPGTVAPYTSGLTGLAGQYGGLTGAGYGTYGALNKLAPQGMAAGYPSEQQLMANSGMAVSGNPAFSSGLMGLASGQYINPSTNPALAGTIQAATQPLVKQYMTATAPQTDSGFEAGGRYGSGAATNAQGQNQYALGQALSGATSNIVNNAYNTGLSTTLQAGNALGGIFNQGLANSSSAAAQAGQLGQAGVGLTGNLLGAGASALNSLGGTGLGGASNNYNMGGALSLQGLQAMMQGYGSAGGLANQGYSTAGGMLGSAGQLANAGTLNLGSLAQMAPELANYPAANLATAYNTGWAPIQNYAGVLGQPIGGNTISQTTTPYYQNTGSQILSGLTGIGQLAGAFASI